MYHLAFWSHLQTNDEVLACVYFIISSETRDGRDLVRSNGQCYRVLMQVMMPVWSPVLPVTPLHPLHFNLQASRAASAHKFNHLLLNQLPQSVICSWKIWKFGPKFFYTRLERATILHFLILHYLFLKYGYLNDRMVLPF